MDGEKLEREKTTETRIDSFGLNAVLETKLVCLVWWQGSGLFLIMHLAVISPLVER